MRVAPIFPTNSIDDQCQIPYGGFFHAGKYAINSSYRGVRKASSDGCVSAQSADTNVCLLYFIIRIALLMHTAATILLYLAQ